jgi:hypothetical protein
LLKQYTLYSNLLYNNIDNLRVCLLFISPARDVKGPYQGGLTD